jgi:hypothetical protein
VRCGAPLCACACVIMAEGLGGKGGVGAVRLRRGGCRVIPVSGARTVQCAVCAFFRVLVVFAFSLCGVLFHWRYTHRRARRHLRAPSHHSANCDGSPVWVTSPRHREGTQGAGTPRRTVAPRACGQWFGF